jgi:hypothetical protein
LLRTVLFCYLVLLFSGGWFVKSFINVEQAHCRILKDSLELKKKKILLALFKIQNGGDNQDGRQTIKRSRILRNNVNNLQLRKIS